MCQEVGDTLTVLISTLTVLISTDSVLISTESVLISTDSVLISTDSVLIITVSVLISTESVLISTGSILLACNLDVVTYCTTVLLALPGHQDLLRPPPCISGQGHRFQQICQCEPRECDAVWCDRPGCFWYTTCFCP